MPFSFFSFSFLYFLLCLAFLLIASFTDLKERIVSNKLNYSIIIIGILLHILESFIIGNYSFLPLFFACIILTFVFSFGLWKFGVWAGGDVKLFTALACLVPLNPSFFPQLLGYSSGIFAFLQIPIFPLTLFIFSIFSMFPMGLFISVHGILKSKKLRSRISGDFKTIIISSLVFALAIAGFEAFFQIAGISLLFEIIPLIILGFLPSRMRNAISIGVFVIALFIISPVKVAENFGISFAGLFLASGFLKLFFFSRSNVLVFEKKISRLTEGEIAGETIAVRNGKPARFGGFSFSETFKCLKNNNLQELFKSLNPSGRLLADRHSAAGLSEKQVRELKKLVKDGKLKDKIKVKLSTPFVPGVLVAFLLLLFLSDVFWRVFFR